MSSPRPVDGHAPVRRRVGEPLSTLEARQMTQRAGRRATAVVDVQAARPRVTRLAAAARGHLLAPAVAAGRLARATAQREHGEAQPLASTGGHVQRAAARRVPAGDVTSGR